MKREINKKIKKKEGGTGVVFGISVTTIQTLKIFVTMRMFYSVFFLLLFFAPALQAQVCMGFDGMSGNYGASNPSQFGQEFYSQAGITLSTTGFVDTNGSVTSTAHFFAGTFLYSGLFTAASGVFVKTNSEANMIISTLPASEVSFDYIDRNSIMNFSVNGQAITVIDNLIDLPAAIAPGVTLSISETTIGSSFIGTLTLTGYITEVIVGGNDMGIDDICFVETAAVCQISGPTVSASACNMTGEFSAEINFDYNEEGANGFTISGNGVNYGTFAYANLPITIDGLAGDNSTNYTFMIADVDNPNCVNEVTLGTVDCPVCGISNVVATPTECVSVDYYTIVVDFDYQNNATGFFDIFLDGQFLEYWTYAELPITMEVAVTSLDPILLTFCDQGSTSCCESVTVDPLNCGGFDCAITNPIATPSACDANGGFTVDLNFDYENAGSSFTVVGNGTSYGTFFYAELPITLDGFIGDNSTVYEFVIVDTGDATCANEVLVGPINCPLPCSLSNVNANPLQCTSDSTFSMTLDFESDNTGSTFSVFATGGAIIGTYNYSSLPLSINDVPVSPGQTIETFNICDVDNPNCCTSVIFDTPNCVPPACELANLIVTSSGCDANGDFGVILNLDQANASTQFSIYVNGSPSGTYLYADLPLSLPSYLEGDGITSYSFLIQDFENPGCSVNYTLQPVNCNVPTCAISNIVVDPAQCTSDSTYSMFINFDYENNGTNGFDISTGGVSLGIFNYTDLPLTLDDFPSSTGTMQNVFICDIDNPDCCQELSFMGTDCTPDPICELGGFETTLSPCNDSTGNFFVTLDFEYANTATTFTVAGNGTIYGTFNYTDLPLTLGPLAGDGSTNYEFVVTDSESPNCVLETVIGTVNCTMDCELFTPVVDPIQCTSDSTFSLFVDFDFVNVSGPTFNMFADGSMVGTYNYADLPLEIADFPSTGAAVVTLMVCDMTDPNCCAFTTFESLDCETECNIFGVTAEALTCDQGLFLVELNVEFQNPGPLGFQVFGNGTNYGNYSYSDLPITIGALEGDGVTEYEFVVADLTNTNCSNFTTIEAVNCLDECVFDEVVATPLNCESDGEFMILLSFSTNNVSSEGYSVSGNGEDYGVFNYDTNALVGPFQGDGTTIYEFILTDAVNQDCVGGVEVEAPLCAVDAVRDAFNGAVAISYNFVGEQVVIKMDTPFAEASDILIYDVTGRLRHTATIAAGTTTEMIDVAHLGTGLFICQLRNSKGSVSESFVNAK